MNFKNKQKNYGKKNSGIIDLEDTLTGQFLDFQQEQEVVQREIINVFIDEEIGLPSKYRYVSKAICDLSEEDEVRFFINSPGGLFSGLQTVLSSLELSGCHSVAVIQGDCSSAASMLALSCKEIHVSPYATMLVHFVSYGSQGSASHIRAHVEHTQRTTEAIFKEIYSGFLTEQEIESCINDDKQLYFDADEILERINNKIEYLNEQVEQDQEGNGVGGTDYSTGAYIENEEYLVGEGLDNCFGSCSGCSCDRTEVGDEQVEEFKNILLGLQEGAQEASNLQGGTTPLPNGNNASKRVKKGSKKVYDVLGRDEGVELVDTSSYNGLTQDPLS